MFTRSQSPKSFRTLRRLQLKYLCSSRPMGLRALSQSRSRDVVCDAYEGVSIVRDLYIDDGLCVTSKVQPAVMQTLRGREATQRHRTHPSRLQSDL